jgi:hypothetical protein
LFVYLKVLRVAADSDILPQTSLLTDELVAIFANNEAPRAVMVGIFLKESD